jgi:hypothetical protein
MQMAIRFLPLPAQRRVLTHFQILQLQSTFSLSVEAVAVAPTLVPAAVAVEPHIKHLYL